MNFRAFSGFFKSLFSGLNDISLSEKEYRERIRFDTVSSTPSIEAKAAAEEEAKAFIAQDDWLGLSRRLQELDRARARCPAGYPLAQIMKDATLGEIADGVYEGHVCHPLPILDISDEWAERLESLSSMHSDSYPLIALAAEARVYQGWLSRGDGYAQYVSEDGWFGMEKRFARAAWLLAECDPVEMDAPMLAAARHRLLGFMPDAERHAVRFYEEWSALDPLDQRPHDAHGQMMLSRWFGDASKRELEARRAVARTSEQTGEAAYFTMYYSVFQAWDPAFLELDAEALARGARDLLALRGHDPAFVATLIQHMEWWTAIGADRDYTAAGLEIWHRIAPEIDAIREELVREHLHAVYPPAWKNGEAGALDIISGVVQSDIQAGATFTLDRNGLTVIPQEPAGDPAPAEMKKPPDGRLLR